MAGESRRSIGGHREPERSCRPSEDVRIYWGFPPPEAFAPRTTPQRGGSEFSASQVLSTRDLWRVLVLNFGLKATENLLDPQDWILNDDAVPLTTYRQNILGRVG